jgi:glutamate dehydrogenase
MTRSAKGGSTPGSPDAEAGAESLVSVIARRLKDSLLPGDAQFVAGELKDAARFALAAAHRRDAGEATVAVEIGDRQGRRRLTRIAVVNDNMPFLVDSISAAIDQAAA